MLVFFAVPARFQPSQKPVSDFKTSLVFESKTKLEESSLAPPSRGAGSSRPHATHVLLHRLVYFLDRAFQNIQTRINQVSRDQQRRRNTQRRMNRSNNRQS